MGKLIVIEGIDGSGKSTQYAKLKTRLEDEGRAFRSLVFPRYDKPSSALIRMYLGGEFGSDPDAVNAFAASSFYSVDRYASYKTEWEEYYRAGGVLLSDRYTTSNAVHQGAKVPDGERAAYFSWLEDFEFVRLGLPRPDKVIYLSVDVETSMRQMKARQENTGTRGDIHETHAEYLKSCIEAGISACEHYGWTKIDCVRGGAMRSVGDIHEEIYSAVSNLF
ncbi:MAG: dTMP kinase [Candidatus Heteroscillospira sp.]|jgi:dTMP kinase